MKRLLILLLISAPAFSYGSEGDENRVEITTVEVDGDFATMSEADRRKVLAKLVHDAEEASEGGEFEAKTKNKVAAFIQEYASKINIPKVALGMLRWYYVQEAKYPSIAADLSVMLLASHSTEMLSGPIGVALSSAGGAPTWVNWLIGVTGGIISIPGLDPLCIGLGWAYVKYPGFRNGVTTSRVFLMKAVTGIGADRFVNWFIQKQNRADFIRNALESEPGKYTYMLEASDGEPGKRYEFRNPQGRVFAWVNFENETTTFVNEVQFDVEAAKTVPTPEFSRMLGLFNSNVSIALSKAYKAFKNGKLIPLGSEYHVLDIVPALTKSTVNIRFRPRALKLTDKVSWSDQLLSWFRCNATMESNP